MKLDRRVPLVLGAIALVSCGTSNTPRDAPVDQPAEASDVETDRPPPPPPPPNPADILSVAIEPPMATLDITVGTTPPRQPFQLFGTRRDGARMLLTNGTWSLSTDRFSMIASDGFFTATGLAAGVVTIRAEAPGAMGAPLRAEAQLTITIRHEIVGSGAPADARTRFATPSVTDPMQSPNVVYPLDAAWMPNNVQPPDVQWTPLGAADDLFRIRVRKPHVDVSAYVVSAAGFQHDWRVEPAVWRILAESDPDDPMVFTVERLPTGSMQPYRSADVRVTLAHGSTLGSIYYWNLTEGSVHRIDANTGADRNFLMNMRSGGSPCMLCHTVSRDGRYMVAHRNSHQITTYDLTASATGDLPPPMYTSPIEAFHSSFDPTASFLISSGGTNWISALFVINAQTGATVMATGLPSGGSAMPEWSPNGGMIVYISNATASTGQSVSGGDLTLLPVLETRPVLTFATPIVIHRGADLAMAVPPGSADSFPSWSPDSEWIAFQHGPGSFSHESIARSLWLISRDIRDLGGGRRERPLFRLDNANRGAMGALSHRPTFSPFVTAQRDGSRLFWMAFFAREPYGNPLAGTAGTNRRQVWVTAIDANPTPGRDPSHVPYWLPGQSAAADNLVAYWAPVACRMTGADCTVSSMCCSGTCRPDPMNPMRSTCQPPPMAECRRRGATCGGNSDCCMGLMCIVNVCDVALG